MKIEEIDSPMQANDIFHHHSGAKSLKSIKKFPETLKTPKLPKIRNSSTEFITPNISQSILNSNEFYNKNWYC